MTDKISTEQVWLRKGKYALGRSGYKPFVALPDKYANYIYFGRDYAGKFAILLFILGFLVTIGQRLELPIPRTTDLLIGIIEGILILLIYSVIARTVITYERLPDRASQWGLELEAQVNDSQLQISFDNYQPFNIIIEDVRIVSTNEILDIDAIDDSTEFPKRVPAGRRGTIGRSEIETAVIVTRNVDRVLEDEMIIIVEVLDDIPFVTQTKEFELTLPITISPSGEIESGVVTESINYETI